MSQRIPSSPHKASAALFLLVLLVLLASPAHAQDTDAQVEPDPVAEWRTLMTGEVTALDALLEAHVGTHPALAMSGARAEVARARAEVVDTLPDPWLRLGLMGMPWMTWAFDASPMTGVELALEWMFPWPGMLGAAREAVLAEADAMALERGEHALELELDAAEMYWMAYELDRTLETLDEIERLLADMQQLAEARYRFGTTREADVLHVGLERSMLDARRLELLAQRAETVARFNALLGREAQAALVPPKDLELARLSDDAAEQLLARALEQRPVFEALDARLEALSAREEAVDWERYPDLMVGASWRFRAAPAASHGGVVDDGEDFIGLMVGVTLPFGANARADDELAMLEAERAMVEVERAATTRRLEVGVQGAVARLEALETQITFTREILLEDARATLDTLVAVYPTGGADFLDLLAAERRILELELELRMQIADHRRLHDGLERLAARPVTADAPP